MDLTKDFSDRQCRRCDGGAGNIRDRKRGRQTAGVSKKDLVDDTGVPADG